MLIWYHKSYHRTYRVVKFLSLSLGNAFRIDSLYFKNEMTIWLNGIITSAGHPETRS